MALNEKIITGRRFRQKINDMWVRFSFWTKAADVEFEDGKNAQQKVDGISSQISELKASLLLLNKDVSEIQVVASLPSDASAHKNTLYIVK